MKILYPLIINLFIINLYSAEQESKQKLEKESKVEKINEIQSFLFEKFEKENQKEVDELKKRFNDWQNSYQNKISIIHANGLRNIYNPNKNLLYLSFPACEFITSKIKNEIYEIFNWWYQEFEHKGFYLKIISRQYLQKVFFGLLIFNDYWYKQDEKKE